MKGIFQILRHTMTSWGMLAGWCIITLFSGVSGEKVSSPGISVIMMALFSVDCGWHQPNWERTLRLLPVDHKKLVLGRFLLNGAAGLVSAAVFGLGLLLGGHGKFGAELPMILGSTVLIGAVRLPLLAKFTETNLQRSGVMAAGAVTGMVCLRLMQRQRIWESNGENSYFLRIEPVSLKTALIFLAVSIAAAAVSYFITCKWDAEREW